MRGFTTGLRVGNNYENSSNYGNFFPTDNSPQTVQNQSVSQTSKPKNPPIPKDVTFTALGCDTEGKLARASYMGAAAKVGVTDVAAQSRFADQMLAANPANLQLTNGNIDDAKVRSRLLNRSVNFILSANEKSALCEFREQYIAEGGQNSWKPKSN